MQEGISKRKAHIDGQLLERVCAGDQDAFRELYEASYRPLYAFLLSYTQNSQDAQDLLKDTYIQVLKNISSYREQGNPMGWMMKIAKNQFLMKCRKEKEKKRVSFEEAENELGFEAVFNVENRMLLGKMFESLSEEDRNLIILHDVSGLKHREIAKMLGLPLGTVLARYRRGIRKLQKEFGEKV